MYPGLNEDPAEEDLKLNPAKEIRVRVKEDLKRRGWFFMVHRRTSECSVFRIETQMILI